MTLKKILLQEALYYLLLMKSIIYEWKYGGSHAEKANIIQALSFSTTNRFALAGSYFFILRALLI